MSFYKVNPLKVDWESPGSALFFNTRNAEKKVFISYIKSLPSLKSHIWLATSGRTQQKWMALSKKAFLVSARAVNQHLKVSAKDRWGLSLPLFHVGGLSILARAHLSRSSCISYQGKWQARAFLDFLNGHQITLSALVPTQVYDLVKEKIKCPPSLRAVVVGGGALSEALYRSARVLNWPLLPSYGLTECSSQVATAEVEALSKKEPSKMKILSHVQVKVVSRKIALRSESLFTGFVPLLPDLKGQFHDTKKNGWYFTGDQGRVEAPYLWIESVSQIKILGEKVNMKLLEEKLMNILLKKSGGLGHCFLLPLPSEREGFQIALVSDIFHRDILSDIIQQFNEKASPFERIRQFYFIPNLELTSLSKISKSALQKKLGFPY